MGILKIPYNDGDFLTIDVDGVYEVDASSAPNMVLKTDRHLGTNAVIGITLEFDLSSFNAADGPGMEAAVLKASQEPASCHVFECAGGIGLVQDEAIDIGAVTI
jgi:hypothetical protein